MARSQRRQQRCRGGEGQADPLPGRQPARAQGQHAGPAVADRYEQQSAFTLGVYAALLPARPRRPGLQRQAGGRPCCSSTPSNGYRRRCRPLRAGHPAVPGGAGQAPVPRLRRSPHVDSGHAPRRGKRSLHTPDGPAPISHAPHARLSPASNKDLSTRSSCGQHIRAVAVVRRAVTVLTGPEEVRHWPSECRPAGRR